MSENVPEYLQQPPNSDEEVISRCQIARALEEKGQYEDAREALGELWPGIGERPDLEGFPPAVAAEVLFRCGTLTRHLGNAKNVAGAQEWAKDMLSEEARMFRAQGAPAKVSETQYELAMCYWWLGQHDEARVV